MSGPSSGEIPNFSDICEDVRHELSSYKIELGVTAGAAVEGVRFGVRSREGSFPYLGISAAFGMVFGAVKGAVDAAAGYSFNVPSFTSYDQRVIKAIAIFKHYEPQLSQSLSDPVMVAKLLSKEGVIEHRRTFINVDEVDSAKATAYSSEAVLEATRKALARDYKRIEIFGDVLCTTPGNEEIGKAICRSYDYYFTLVKIYDIVKEGVVELNVTRVNMYGPPGAGKTCSKLLLLNEDPPSVPVTDSTSIIYPSVRAYSSNETKYMWERVTKEGLIERVSADLWAKANEEPSNKISPSPDILLPDSEDFPDIDTSDDEDSAPQNGPADGGPSKKPSSPEIQGDITDKQQKTKESLQKILRTGQNHNDVHVKGNWLYIIDSGGQPAFQELLSLFTRVATLSIIVLNLSKPFDEEFEFTYRVKGKEYPCHYKSTQLACFKSAVSSGTIFEPPSIPWMKEKALHSTHLVLGTHIDKVPDESLEKQKDTLRSSVSSLQPYLRNRVLENRLEKSFIFPVNTLAQGKERSDYNRQICKAMDKSGASFPVYIPIRWFVFELALPEKSIITVKEALDIGAEYGMNKKDTELALQYLHDVTLILYYPEVLDVVFPDPQPILKVLSDLLALTYIVDDDAIATNVEQREINNLKDGFFNEDLLMKLNSYKSISNELASGHMIKLLLHLHIISEVEETSKGKYFIPYALPLCTTTVKKPEPEVKPLLVVWREEEDILPVPQGLFPLTIGHLLNQKERKVVIPPSTSDFYKYRDTMSLRITIKEQSHTLHIVNCYTHIEVYFTGPKEYRPEVRTLFKKAIDESANAMHMKHNYIYAFACPKKESCYCIVKESKGVVDCTLCPEPADITSKDMTYWSWFIISSSSGSGQTYNPDDLMKKVPKDADLFVVFKDYEHNFKLIGTGLDVRVTGIKYDPEDPTECLRLVFVNWREKNEDVTWKKISEVCDDFPDKFGKAQSNLREHLSTKRVYEKYIDKPDFKP